MHRPKQIPLLRLRNLAVARGDKMVLHGVDLEIRRGEHVAILGPNGCGKSTLIKAITRELYPVAGRPGCTCEILGREDWDISALRRRLGIVEMDALRRVSHEVTLRSVPVRDFVVSGFFNSIGLWPHHRVRAEHLREAHRVMRFLGIAHLGRQPIDEVSSGEQRRAMIGRALVHKPEALVLDEPTNSLDPGAVREFRALLRDLSRSGRSLLLVTHHVADLIPEIDRVILLQDGRILADGPKDEVLTTRRLSLLFSRPLRVVRRGDAFDLIDRPQGG